MEGVHLDELMGKVASWLFLNKEIGLRGHEQGSQQRLCIRERNDERQATVWPDNLMKRHIRPVARANGINKRIGWHTFRHTFGNC
jgi:hypothetical protein